MAKKQEFIEVGKSYDLIFGGSAKVTDITKKGRGWTIHFNYWFGHKPKELSLSLIVFSQVIK